MPSSYTHGSPIESAEISEFQHRYFAALRFPSAQAKDVASHSMKACFLAVFAKFGVPLPLRQFLGYHAAKGERSALNYGRDNLGEPVAALEGAIHAVRDGLFVPDNFRVDRRPRCLVPALDIFHTIFGHDVVRSALEGMTLENLRLDVKQLEYTLVSVDEQPGDLCPSISDGVISDSDSDQNPEGRPPPAEDDTDDVGPNLVGDVVSAISSSSTVVMLIVRHRRRGTCHRLSPDPACASCGEPLGEASSSSN